MRRSGRTANRSSGPEFALFEGVSSRPFDLEGLDHVVLLVQDMAAARTFYCDVIGCTVDRELPQYGMVQLRAGAALIDLVDTASEEGAWARPPVAGGRNMDHVCLAIGSSDEAAMRAHLAAHRVEIVEEGIRYGAKGDGMSFYVRDPFGNTLELKGPGTA
jgi:glyoxylase I family protein